MGWGIPNVGMRGASQHVAALAGEPVYSEARDRDYEIRPATPAELAAAKAKREAVTRPAIPAPNLAVTELRRIEQLDAADFATVGPKAANLGVIVRAKTASTSCRRGRSSGTDRATPPGFLPRD